MNKPEHERLSAVIKDTVSLLIKNGVSYTTQLSIQGLIAISLDQEEMFAVNFTEVYGDGEDTCQCCGQVKGGVTSSSGIGGAKLTAATVRAQRKHRHRSGESTDASSALQPPAKVAKPSGGVTTKVTPKRERLAEEISDNESDVEEGVHLTDTGVDDETVDESSELFVPPNIDFSNIMVKKEDESPQDELSFQDPTCFSGDDSKDLDSSSGPFVTGMHKNARPEANSSTSEGQGLPGWDNTGAIPSSTVGSGAPPQLDMGLPAMTPTFPFGTEWRDDNKSSLQTKTLLASVAASKMAWPDLPVPAGAIPGLSTKPGSDVASLPPELQSNPALYGLDSSPELVQLKCPFCPYGTTVKGNFRRHMLVHRDYKSFKCPTCDYRSNYMMNIRRHYQTMHTMNSGAGTANVPSQSGGQDTTSHQPHLTEGWLRHSQSQQGAHDQTMLPQVTMNSGADTANVSSQSGGQDTTSHQPHSAESWQRHSQSQQGAHDQTMLPQENNPLK